MRSSHKFFLIPNLFTRICSGDATAEPEALAYERSMTLEQRRELEAQRHKELQRKYVFRQKTNDEVAEALEVVDH